MSSSSVPSSSGAGGLPKASSGRDSPINASVPMPKEIIPSVIVRSTRTAENHHPSGAGATNGDIVIPTAKKTDELFSPRSLESATLDGLSAFSPGTSLILGSASVSGKQRGKQKGNKPSIPKPQISSSGKVKFTIPSEQSAMLKQFSIAPQGDGALLPSSADLMDIIPEQYQTSNDSVAPSIHPIHRSSGDMSVSLGDDASISRDGGSIAGGAIYHHGGGGYGGRPPRPHKPSMWGNNYWDTVEGREEKKRKEKEDLEIAKQLEEMKKLEEEEKKVEHETLLKLKVINTLFNKNLTVDDIGGTLKAALMRRRKQKEAGESQPVKVEDALADSDLPEKLGMDHRKLSQHIEKILDEEEAEEVAAKLNLEGKDTGEGEGDADDASVGSLNTISTSGSKAHPGVLLDMIPKFRSRDYKNKVNPDDGSVSLDPSDRREVLEDIQDGLAILAASKVRDKLKTLSSYIHGHTGRKISANWNMLESRFRASKYWKPGVKVDTNGLSHQVKVPSMYPSSLFHLLCSGKVKIGYKELEIIFNKLNISNHEIQCGRRIAGLTHLLTNCSDLREELIQPYNEELASIVGEEKSLVSIEDIMKFVFSPKPEVREKELTDLRANRTMEVTVLMEEKKKKDDLKVQQEKRRIKLIDDFEKILEQIQLYKSVLTKLRLDQFLGVISYCDHKITEHFEDQSARIPNDIIFFLGIDAFPVSLQERLQARRDATTAAKMHIPASDEVGSQAGDDNVSLDGSIGSNATGGSSAAMQLNNYFDNDGQPPDSVVRAKLAGPPHIMQTLRKMVALGKTFPGISYREAVEIMQYIAVTKIAAFARGYCRRWRYRAARKKWMKIFHDRMIKALHGWQKVHDAAISMRRHILRKVIAWRWYTKRVMRRREAFRLCFWPLFVWRKYAQSSRVAKEKTKFLVGRVMPTLTLIQMFKAWRVAVKDEIQNNKVANKYQFKLVNKFGAKLMSFWHKWAKTRHLIRRAWNRRGLALRRKCLSDRKRMIFIIWRIYVFVKVYTRLRARRLCTIVRHALLNHKKPLKKLSLTQKRIAYSKKRKPPAKKKKNRKGSTTADDKPVKESRSSIVASKLADSGDSDASTTAGSKTGKSRGSVVGSFARRSSNEAEKQAAKRAKQEEKELLAFNYQLMVEEIQRKKTRDSKIRFRWFRKDMKSWYDIDSDGDDQNDIPVPLLKAYASKTIGSFDDVEVEPTPIKPMTMSGKFKKSLSINTSGKMSSSNATTSATASANVSSTATPQQPSSVATSPTPVDSTIPAPTVPAPVALAPPTESTSAAPSTAPTSGTASVPAGSADVSVTGPGQRSPSRPPSAQVKSSGSKPPTPLASMSSTSAVAGGSKPASAIPSASAPHSNSAIPSRKMSAVGNSSVSTPTGTTATAKGVTFQSDVSVVSTESSIAAIGAELNIPPHLPLIEEDTASVNSAMTATSTTSAATVESIPPPPPPGAAILETIMKNKGFVTESDIMDLFTETSTLSKIIDPNYLKRRIQSILRGYHYRDQWNLLDTTFRFHRFAFVAFQNLRNYALLRKSYKTYISQKKFFMIQTMWLTWKEYVSHRKSILASSQSAMNEDGTKRYTCEMLTQEVRAQHISKLARLRKLKQEIAQFDIQTKEEGYESDEEKRLQNKMKKLNLIDADDDSYLQEQQKKSLQRMQTMRIKQQSFHANYQPPNMLELDREDREVEYKLAQEMVKFSKLTRMRNKDNIDLTDKEIWAIERFNARTQSMVDEVLDMETMVTMKAVARQEEYATRFKEHAANILITILAGIHHEVQTKLIKDESKVYFRALRLPMLIARSKKMLNRKRIMNYIRVCKRLIAINKKAPYYHAIRTKWIIYNKWLRYVEENKLMPTPGFVNMLKRKLKLHPAYHEALMSKGYKNKAYTDDQAMRKNLSDYKVLFYRWKMFTQECVLFGHYHKRVEELYRLRTLRKCFWAIQHQGGLKADQYNDVVIKEMKILPCMRRCVADLDQLSKRFIPLRRKQLPAAIRKKNRQAVKKMKEDGKSSQSFKRFFTYFKAQTTNRIGTEQRILFESFEARGVQDFEDVMYPMDKDDPIVPPIMTKLDSKPFMDPRILNPNIPDTIHTRAGSIPSGFRMIKVKFAMQITGGTGGSTMNSMVLGWQIVWSADGAREVESTPRGNWISAGVTVQEINIPKDDFVIGVEYLYDGPLMVGARFKLFHGGFTKWVGGKTSLSTLSVYLSVDGTPKADYELDRKLNPDELRKPALPYNYVIGFTGLIYNNKTTCLGLVVRKIKKQHMFSYHWVQDMLNNRRINNECSDHVAMMVPGGGGGGIPGIPGPAGGNGSNNGNSVQVDGVVGRTMDVQSIPSKVGIPGNPGHDVGKKKTPDANVNDLHGNSLMEDSLTMNPSEFGPPGVRFQQPDTNTSINTDSADELDDLIGYVPSVDEEDSQGEGGLTIDGSRPGSPDILGGGSDDDSLNGGGGGEDKPKKKSDGAAKAKLARKYNRWKKGLDSKEFDPLTSAEIQFFDVLRMRMTELSSARERAEEFAYRLWSNKDLRLHPKMSKLMSLKIVSAMTFWLFNSLAKGLLKHCPTEKLGAVMIRQSRRLQIRAKNLFNRSIVTHQAALLLENSIQPWTGKPLLAPIERAQKKEHFAKVQEMKDNSKSFEEQAKKMEAQAGELERSGSHLLPRVSLSVELYGNFKAKVAAARHKESLLERMTLEEIKDGLFGSNMKEELLNKDQMEAIHASLKDRKITLKDTTSLQRLVDDVLLEEEEIMKTETTLKLNAEAIAKMLAANEKKGKRMSIMQSLSLTASSAGGSLSRPYSVSSSMSHLPPAAGSKQGKKPSLAISVTTPVRKRENIKFIDDLSAASSPPESRRSSQRGRTRTISHGTLGSEDEEAPLVLPPIAMSKTQSGPLPKPNSRGSNRASSSGGIASAGKTLKNSKSAPVTLGIEDDTSTIPDLGSHHTADTDSLIAMTKKKIAKKSGSAGGGTSGGTKKSVK